MTAIQLTADEAMQEALDWVEGRKSWVNHLDLSTPGLHFLVDALQTQAWAAVAQALYAREAARSSSGRTDDGTG